MRKRNSIYRLTDGPLLPLALAALLRVAYWVYVHNQPWFQTPGMDPEFYQEWASAILAGRGGDWLPFPRGPLYTYCLAGIWKMFGHGWLAPRLFNLAADLLTVWVVHRLGHRLAGRTAGLAAGFCFALCGAGIYYSGELLMTSLETALAACGLWMLVRLFESPTPAGGVSAGMVLALFCLCRPNALLLLAAAPMLLLIWRARSSVVRLNRYWIPTFVGMTTLIAYAVAALLTLAPVTYYNYAATGRLVPVATQGGVNFFIGNARGATGWASILPGVGADWTNSDAESKAEADAGGALAPYERSRQLWRMGLREIAADPAGWLRLMGRKLLLLVNVREIGNNRPLTLPLDAAPFLRVLFLISLGSLIPPALVGWKPLAQSRAPAAVSALLFAGLFGGSLLLFFVNTRYRMPLIPPAAVLAGVGIAQLSAALRDSRQRWRSIRRLAAGCLLTLPPYVGSSFDNVAQGLYVTGNALLKQGRPREAADCYAGAARIESSYPKLHLNWGAALLAAGDTAAAEAQFGEELRLHPGGAEAINNLGIVSEGRDDLASARGYYRQALAGRPDYADARVNLFRAELKLGDRLLAGGEPDSAAAHYSSAEALFPDDPRSACRLGVAEAAAGRFGEARAAAERALAIRPDYAPARRLLEALPPPE